MLTNITPGFYKMRNGRMAVAGYYEQTILDNVWIVGFYMENGSLESIAWRVENGTVVSETQETSYDLMERIEC